MSNVCLVHFWFTSTTFPSISLFLTTPIRPCNCCRQHKNLLWHQQYFTSDYIHVLINSVYHWCESSQLSINNSNSVTLHRGKSNRLSNFSYIISIDSLCLSWCIIDSSIIFYWHLKSFCLGYWSFCTHCWLLLCHNRLVTLPFPSGNPLVDILSRITLRFSA